MKLSDKIKTLAFHTCRDFHKKKPHDPEAVYTDITLEFAIKLVPLGARGYVNWLLKGEPQAIIDKDPAEMCLRLVPLRTELTNKIKLSELKS